MKRTPRHDLAVQKRLARTIEQRRAKKNIPVAKLASSADVDISQMVKALRGEVGLSIYSLKRVASALDWSLGELAIAAFPPKRRPNPSHA